MPANLSQHFEFLVFVWMKLNNAAMKVLIASTPGAESPGTAAEGWPEAGSWLAAAAQMDHALGLDGLLPVQPLLWKRGGRPLPPRTHALLDGLAVLRTLCDCSWVMGAGFGSDHRGQPAALGAAGINLTALQEDEGPLLAEDRELLAAAVAAAVATDSQLRRALLEGLCLFLASAVLSIDAGSIGGGELEDMPRLLRERLEQRAAEEADVAVAVLRTRIGEPGCPLARNLSCVPGLQSCAHLAYSYPSFPSTFQTNRQPRPAEPLMLPSC